MRSSVLAVAVMLLCAGCAHEQQQSFAPSMAPSFSTPSESFQTSYVSRGSTNVQRMQVNADVVVRPDRVCVPVRISASADEKGLAMKLVEEAAKKLSDSAGEGATLRIDDIDARSDRLKDGARSSVTMTGVVERELPATDAWQRAKEVSALHRALVENVTVYDNSKSKSDGPQTPIAEIAVGNPEPGVRDIEAHRAKLLASWGERAKALATVAAASGANLELINCVPPAQVVIAGGTLEKVGLNLPVSCTFQVRKP